MKTHSTLSKRGFTLMETVIAIGVLAVLLTAFIGVFAPAALGIRKALSGQEADRLIYGVVQEMTNLRENERTANTYSSNFDKAFQMIQGSTTAADALLVYQYRGSLTQLRTDGSAEPVKTITGIPGQDYTVQPMMRKLDDTNLESDLAAVEGRVYIVKCTQLINDSSGTTAQMKPGTAGTIEDPETKAAVQQSEDYTSALLVFNVDFYAASSNSSAYIKGGAFKTKFAKLSSPVLSRTLSVQR